jgi:hypothetical protein
LLTFETSRFFDHGAASEGDVFEQKPRAGERRARKTAGHIKRQRDAPFLSRVDIWQRDEQAVSALDVLVSVQGKQADAGVEVDVQARAACDRLRECGELSAKQRA